jgi:hypothetical protein
LASPCQLLLKFPCMAGPLVRRVSSDWLSSLLCLA